MVNLFKFGGTIFQEILHQETKIKEQLIAKEKSERIWESKKKVQLFFSSVNGMCYVNSKNYSLNIIRKWIRKQNLRSILGQITLAAVTTPKSQWLNTIKIDISLTGLSSAGQ